MSHGRGGFLRRRSRVPRGPLRKPRAETLLRNLAREIQVSSGLVETQADSIRGTRPKSADCRGREARDTASPARTWPYKLDSRSSARKPSPSSRAAPGVRRSPGHHRRGRGRPIDKLFNLEEDGETGQARWASAVLLARRCRNHRTIRRACATRRPSRPAGAMPGDESDLTVMMPPSRPTRNPPRTSQGRRPDQGKRGRLAGAPE